MKSNRQMINSKLDCILNFFVFISDHSVKQPCIVISLYLRTIQYLRCSFQYDSPTLLFLRNNLSLLIH